MVDDTCVFYREILTKPTDRNLVEGKGNWSAKLNDLSFVILSTSPDLLTFANNVSPL